MTGEPAQSGWGRTTLKRRGEATISAPFSTSAGRGRSFTAGRETGGLRRFAALDGVRALAVVAVLLYHAGVSWMGGGLLGVDVFFVLSGFLITSLLCRELSRSSTVRLGRFWAQRARRLLPGLLILLLGVAAYAFTFRNSIDVSAVRGDALATLLYFANWHFIFSDQGYFVQAAAPSPLLHTWSLAVEEQYYLVWPVVALLVVRRWGSRALAVVAGAGAATSAILMASLFAAGVSVDRLYYGTDTRAQALLVGSVLGAIGTHQGDVFSIVRGRQPTGRLSRSLLTALGLGGAVFLGWAWHALAGQSPLLYRGGFFLVALAAGAVIASCVTLPASLLARVLSARALVFVGRISYGLYLYHWPLFLVLNHAHTGLTGAGLLAVRLLVTVAVATVSFVFVEEPIRSGRTFRGHLGLGLAGISAAIAAVVVTVATVAPATDAVAAPRRSGLTSSEHAALVSAGAFSTHPISFLLVGDSVALTLGVGLYPDALTRYGIRLYDGGTLGCDLDNVPVRLSGVVGPATPGCRNWRSSWKAGVDHFHPDVVGVLVGRWEVSDHLYQGRWVHIGEPIWDRHLTAELSQAVGILSSAGARVVFFTMPYVDPPVEAADGSPFPENDPSRMSAFNQLLVSVAASRKNAVSVIDLNKLVDPDGQYQPVVDGVTVRSTDGVHLTKVGGEWLQPDILPTVDNLALAARSTMVRP